MRPLLLCALLWFGCTDLADQRTVVLAHNMNTAHPVHRGIEVFAEEVARLSEGRIRVRIYPNAQLGSEREVLELLQIGSVAMTKVSAASLANFAPVYQVLGIPYLFRDTDHLFEVLEGPVGEELLAAGSTYWLRGLAFYDAGNRSFYTKERPVRSPADLAGLKVRVMSHQPSIDLVNALGGNATPLSFGELYTALQQGVVDGAENNPPSFVTSRHFEVCKYYTLDEHSCMPDVLLVGTRFWDGLLPTEQDVLREAARRSVVAQRRFWAETVADNFRTLEAAGVTVIRPDKAAFAAAAAPVLAAFRRDSSLAPLIQRIQATSQ